MSGSRQKPRVLMSVDATHQTTLVKMCVQWGEKSVEVVN